MVNAKRKAPVDLFRIDRYERNLSVWPLRGLKRLVKVQRRRTNGVLICDHVVRVADTITFAPSNTRRTQFTIGHETPALGFLGEPRLSAPNEASAEEMRRFYDEGSTYTFAFTPEAGKTYSMECDIYRPLDTILGGGSWRLFGHSRIANYFVSVDLSAYTEANYQLLDPPTCELATEDVKGPDDPLHWRRRTAVEIGGRRWKWRIKNAQDGMIRLYWAVKSRGTAGEFASVNIDQLATELSVNARVAKDLHNFMSICHYYAADVRSMNAIGRKMVADRSGLMRSLDSLEDLIGAEVIERANRKGLIRITPAGEAVLEWWSRFYMRWTPIAPDPDGPN